MDNQTKDRIRGVIFGNAVGDALGRAMEFMTKREIKERYPNGVRSYDDIDMNDWFRLVWKRGEWTDDTNQMICIMDSIIENKRVIPTDIAKRFIKWASEDGRGMGSTTSQSFFHPLFLIDPHGAAEDVWWKNERKIAANGGVMRTSVIGVWDYNNADNVISNAENACKITHFDPRCVASCVAVSLAISMAIQGKESISCIARSAANRASKFDKGIEQIIKLAENGNIWDLHLDKGEMIGYTYKTAHAGFWEFIQAENFHDGMIEIIHEGGDSDTNGAVAGALMGARFGFSNIPIKWITGLVQAKQLAKKVDALIGLLE